MSAVRLRGKRSALRKVNSKELAEVLKLHLEDEPVKDDPFPMVIELLTQISNKEVKIPEQKDSRDYSLELAALGEKLDKLAARENPEHSNADVVEALGKVEKILKSLKTTPKSEPLITGFSIAERDLLGRVKEIELVRDA